MELAEDQSLYLQNIYDYFHVHDQWPTYRHIERVLSQVRRTLDIEEIAKSLPMGFATAFAFNHDLNAEAILSISAIHLCKGSEEDLADFIKVLRFCVEKYFNAQEDDIQISSQELRSHLNMSESSACKMGLLLKDASEYPIWSTFGWMGQEGKEWLCTLTRNIRYLNAVASIEQYLEKLHQLKATSVSSRIGRAQPGVDISMSYDQQNKSGKSGNTDAETLTIWGKLLNECRIIEEIAVKIQAGDNKGDLCTDLTTEEIEGLIEQYYAWFGDCLSILPDDLKDRFRLAYEGDRSSASASISIFLRNHLSISDLMDVLDIEE